MVASWLCLGRLQVEGSQRSKVWGEKHEGAGSHVEEGGGLGEQVLGGEGQVVNGEVPETLVKRKVC